MSGRFESDARYDSLYVVARRQHTEALRRAAMDRLAHSVDQGRRQGKSRRTWNALQQLRSLVVQRPVHSNRQAEAT